MQQDSALAVQYGIVYLETAIGPFAPHVLTLTWGVVQIGVAVAVRNQPGSALGMRSLTEATLYPGVGLLETTNVSVGRGTDTPFEVVGAPWIRGDRLAEYLNQRGVPGVRFVALRFTPNASVFKGEECGGVNIIVTDRAAFRPLVTGIEMALALRKLYANDWNVDKYLRLLVNTDTLERVKRGESARDIAASWNAGLEEFKRARAEVLLYN